MNKIKKYSKTHFWVFFLLLSLLFKPLWLFEMKSMDPGDDLSYWLHSASLAIDGDLDYIEDYKINSEVFHPVTNAPYHSPGSGFAAAPYVFIFNQIDKVNDNSFDRINPIGTYSYLGFFTSTLFYCFIGFYFLRKIVLARKIVLSPYMYLIVFLSTLVHFVTTRFFMPHSFEFFLCCFLLYLYETKENLIEKRLFLLLISLYFLLSITRPSTFIFSLCLVGFYHDKFKINGISLSDLALNFLTFAFFSFIYFRLSNILYVENFVLLNLSNNSTTTGFVNDLNIQHYFYGLKRLPALIISPSMGLIWIMPLILSALYFLIIKSIFLNLRNYDLIKKISIAFYFIGAFSVLLIWQGREVAYGQRLLIGIIPFCFIYVVININNSKLFYRLFFPILYIQYLYFYSPGLSLESGTTLWGTEVAYAAHNYLIKLLSNIGELENISYIFLKNIYFVNFTKFINYETFTKLNTIDEIISTTNTRNKFIEVYEMYSSVNLDYLLTSNLIIFVFCYLFSRMVFSNR